MADGDDPFEAINRPLPRPLPQEPSDRSRAEYQRLSRRFGVLGRHNFYAGRTWQGAVELAVFGVSAAVLAGLLFLGLGEGTRWAFLVAPLALGGVIGPGLVAIVERISVERDGQGRLFRP